MWRSFWQSNESFFNNFRPAACGLAADAQMPTIASASDLVIFETGHGCKPQPNEKLSHLANYGEGI